MKPMKFVVSPTVRAFHDWCRRNQVVPNLDAVLVQAPEQINGRRMDLSQVRFLPGAEKLPYYQDVVRAITAATSKSA